MTPPLPPRRDVPLTSRDEIALRVFAAVFASASSLDIVPSPERSALFRDVATLAFDAADEFRTVQFEREIT